MAARKPVDSQSGRAALAKLEQSPDDRTAQRTAVKWLLEELARRAPGHAVEVRVPPFAAVQVIAGPRHTRGTPPAVVEMSAQTWLSLATGRLEWSAALQSGAIWASGQRTDLSPLLPLISRPISPRPSAADPQRIETLTTAKQTPDSVHPPPRREGYRSARSTSGNDPPQNPNDDSDQASNHHHRRDL